MNNLVSLTRLNLLFSTLIVLGSYQNTFAQCCTNCPQQLPDNATESFFVYVTDDGSADCNLATNSISSVTTNFDHEYLGDLKVTMISPDGSSIELIGNPGTWGNTDGNFNEGDNIGDEFNSTFVVSTAGAPQGIFDTKQVTQDNFASSFDGRVDVINGTYHPYVGNLEDFTGTLCGTWTFLVEDVQNVNSGDFSDFAINFSDGTGLSCSSVLPVELVSFSTHIKDVSVVLNWRTAFEQNNSGFEIQRSTDGLNFYKIGWVDGEGDSDREIAYQYTDQEVQRQTKYYYRLRQVDFDGADDFSPIRVVITIGKEDAISIQPNPVQVGEVVQIHIYAAATRRGQIRVFNLTGQEVLRQSISTVKGENEIAVAVTDLARGNYFVKVILGKETHYQKLIVQ